MLHSLRGSPRPGKARCDADSGASADPPVRAKFYLYEGRKRP